MSDIEWPEWPELFGRPLDTAIFVHRDYLDSLRDHILARTTLHDRDAALFSAFLPLLENTMAITNAMSKQGPAQHAALGSFGNIQLSAHPQLSWNVEKPNETLEGRSGDERTLKVMKYNDVLQTGGTPESATETLTGSEEMSQDADGGSNSGATSGSHLAAAVHAPNNAGAITTPAAPVSKIRHKRNVEVTIVIQPYDSDIRRELAPLTHDESKRRVQLDIQPLKLRVRCLRRMTTSGDIRFKTSAAGALVLRNSSKYTPRNFGLNAHVRTAPPQSW
ncbi:MAG: hypothetical protein Q9169_002739 [Polycauliona sp. 2 TL-2023]